jgi:hypothetical protein
LDIVKNLTLVWRRDFKNHMQSAADSHLDHPTQRRQVDTFYSYFKENMNALGLPAPEGLFGTFTTAVATSSTLGKLVEQFGSKVTIRELIGAGTKLEILGVVAACSVSYYLGAVIGSIAVASGRTLSGGTSLVDVIETASRWGLNQPWLQSHLQRWPMIYQGDATNRRVYGIMATA